MKRKRSTQGSAPAKKRAVGAGPAAQQPFRKKSLAVTLAPEKKFQDTSFSTDATTTETVVSLTTFAAGDTALLRDGNKIICNSCELRIRLTNEALTQNNIVRFALVQAKQANAAAPTWFAANPLTDVFDAATVTARRNTASSTKFKIILDEVIVVNQTSGTGGALQEAYWHKWVKLPEEVTQFADGTSAIPVTNAYFLMYIGTVAAGATDLDVNGTARIRFMG